MRIGAAKDFKRARGKVFDTFADPARMDAVFAEQGTNLRREGPGGPGTVWHLDAVSRGKAWPMAITMVDMEKPEVMRMRVTSAMVDADVAFVFADLPGKGCQVRTEVDLVAHTLTARVAIQTLRLAKGKVEQRIQRALFALGKPG